MPDEWRQALAAEATDFEVWPENWPIVDLWLRVQTQWRSSGFGPTGLDYVAVDVVMRRLRIEDPDGEKFEGLQVMEIEALKVLQKEASK